jgi:hypothetical protein
MRPVNKSVPVAKITKMSNKLNSIPPIIGVNTIMPNSGDSMPDISNQASSRCAGRGDVHPHDISWLIWDTIELFAKPSKSKTHIQPNAPNAPKAPDSWIAHMCAVAKQMFSVRFGNGNGRKRIMLLYFTVSLITCDAIKPELINWRPVNSDRVVQLIDQVYALMNSKWLSHLQEKNEKNIVNAAEIERNQISHQSSLSNSFEDVVSAYFDI